LASGEGTRGGAGIGGRSQTQIFQTDTPPGRDYINRVLSQIRKLGYTGGFPWQKIAAGVVLVVAVFVA